MKKFGIILSLIFLLSNCSKQPNLIISDFPNTQIEYFTYAFSINKNAKKINFYLNDSSQIKILYKKDEKDIEEFIFISPVLSIKFNKIIQEQLDLKNIMRPNNNLNGTEISFYRISKNGYFLSTYKNVNDLKKEISPEFDSLVNSILVQKKIVNIFNK